jgi:hypothetical protein
MNKPILAAAAGVSFGFFLGALFFLCPAKRTCHRDAAAHVRITQIASVKAAPPCTRSLYAPQPTPRPDAFDSKDPDSVLSAAQAAYVSADYDRAAELAQSVKEQRPLRAWRILGAVACQQQDVKLADKAFSQLDLPAQQYLVYVCERNGVLNRGKHFRLAHGR